jgi:hypothetical protein
MMTNQLVVIRLVYISVRPETGSRRGNISLWALSPVLQNFLTSEKSLDSNVIFSFLHHMPSPFISITNRTKTSKGSQKEPLLMERK